MKVLTQQPVTFLTADVLPPEDLNRVFLYGKDALADVVQRRWSKCAFTMPFVEAVDTPYTNAMNTEELRYRFTPPVNCVIERGYLHADLTCTAELQIVVERASDSSTPTGATVPFLTTKGAFIFPASGTPSQSSDGIIGSATSDVVAFTGDKFILLAGVEYQFRISGGGTFTANRLDVTLHVAVDRWSLGGSLAIPDFQPTLFTDLTGADATVVNANITAFGTQAALLANALSAPVPALFVKHGLTNATSLAQRRFTIPRHKSTRALCTLKRVYLYCYTAGATTITAIIRDETGAQLGSTITAAVGAGGQLSVDSGALSTPFSGGGGDPSDPTKDYTIEFANSSATNGIKIYATAWFARA